MSRFAKPTAPSSFAPVILNNRLRPAVAQTVSLRSWLALIPISRENAQCRSGLESGGFFSRNSLILAASCRLSSQFIRQYCKSFPGCPAFWKWVLSRPETF